ncbi:hypothetical protein KQX54_016544 [Cotesia glomerata]|uniref:MULE transposase domain-containing protein n=1 Tax=Cotesia glomerata TaxID=32391 RepID=A0AAV7HYB9_COTGL|nr:hypothetical protein KQX54_016544 [Cotesia glomerata]
MPNKEQITNRVCLKYFKNEICPRWHPQAIVSDWETAIRNETQATFPAADLIGCFFHYTQAIQRNWQKRASAKEINTLFIHIINKALPEVACILNDFFGYVYSEWLCKIGPDNLSVFGKLKLRTNNRSEAINRDINRFLYQIKKPKAMQFTKVLVSSVVKAHHQIISLSLSKEKAYVRQSDSQVISNRPATLGSNLNILWNNLKAGTITIKAFFEQCSILQNKVHLRKNIVKLSTNATFTWPPGKTTLWIWAHISRGPINQLHLDGVQYLTPQMHQELIPIVRQNLKIVMENAGKVLFDHLVQIQITREVE